MFVLFQLAFTLAQLGFVILDSFAVHSFLYARTCEDCPNQITRFYSIPCFLHAIAISIHFIHWWKHERGNGAVNIFTEILHLIAAAAFAMTGVLFAFGNVVKYALWLNLAVVGLWIFKSWFDGYVIMEDKPGKKNFYIAYLVQITGNQIVLSANLTWIAYFYMGFLIERVYKSFAIASLIGDILLMLAPLIYIRGHASESENYMEVASINEAPVFGRPTRQTSGYPHWN